ncbi:amino acid permease [Fulvimarina sp. 2208YS6-2-32]|uniref:Amino acid permease n=1 Tax=Fulvimarina uroteuthidis TaxID=3098149 RepID=A0ABU5I244_9HYPH|nr:amino acid permease [Fulvimarina sp. 2208YS6-2-32]MDY8109400.1 amino acid permease [Fulvimarina sp. 2208YS6-2-32]
MSELTKTLGPVSGTAMMLNTVLGAGVLILPGLAAQEIGAMSLWTWVACALLSVPLLTMFAILAGRYPRAGGVGHIAGQAFGAFGNVATSFLFLGAVAVGLPSIALTGGYYLGSGTGIDPSLGALVLLGLAVAANLTLPGTASKIGTAVSIAIAVFLCALAVGSIVVLWGPTGPATPPAPDVPMPTFTLFVAFMLVFFAFTGWEVAIGISEEFRDPERNVPKAVFASFLIAVAFYILCAGIIIAAGPNAYTAAPFLAILGPSIGNIGVALMSTGTALLIAANLFAAVWAVSRMLLSLSREGYLPALLHKTRKGSPRPAVLAAGAIISIGIGLDAADLVDVGNLFATAGQNFLLIYGISAAALFRLGRSLVDRAIAVVSIVVVAGLVIVAGLHLFYPSALLVLAGVLVAVRHRFDRTGPGLARSGK